MPGGEWWIFLWRNKEALGLNILFPLLYIKLDVI